MSLKLIDAHHHLWNLKAVHYPWLMAKGEPRFFGDPETIQRDYLLDEHRRLAAPHGIAGSVHIQVGAENGLDEARWVDAVARENPDWPMVQVAFCDLTAPDRDAVLDRLEDLDTVVGVRQIVGRAPGEDAITGTNTLLANPRFRSGLEALAERGLSFDLQLIPELMAETAALLRKTPRTKVVLCHAGSPHDRSAAGLAQWAERLRQISELPDVFCKLSGLGMFDHSWTAATIQPIVETVLAQFGPRRTMWGSNFPVDSLTSDYDALIRAHKSLVPEAHHAAVFSRTAEEFYGLTP